MSSPNLQIENGNFQDSEGNLLVNGYLLFQLSHDECYASGPAQIVGGLKYTISLNSSGNIPTSPAVMVYSNDVLTPSGSYYIVRAFKADGTEAWASPQFWTLTSSPNPLDVGTIVPSNPPGAGLGGGGTTLLLETNGTVNSNQALLNLTGGSGISVANSSGTTTISGSGGVDPSSSRFVVWTPGSSSGGDWITVNDFKAGLDGGATAAFNNPTLTTNYALALTGNRVEGGLPVFYGGRTFTFKGLVDSATGTISTGCYIGLADSVTTVWNSGIGASNFAAFITTGTTWTCEVGNSVSTTSASTSVSASTRHLFEIDYTPTSVVFKSDGTTVATITTNIPSTAAMGVMFYSKGNGSQVFTAEYMYCNQAAV